MYPKIFGIPTLPSSQVKRGSGYVSDPSISHSSTMMIGEEGKGITGDFRGCHRAQIKGITHQPFPSCTLLTRACQVTTSSASSSKQLEMFGGNPGSARNQPRFCRAEISSFLQPISWVCATASGKRMLAGTVTSPCITTLNLHHQRWPEAPGEPSTPFPGKRWERVSSNPPNGLRKGKMVLCIHCHPFHPEILCPTDAAFTRSSIVTTNNLNL